MEISAWGETKTVMDFLNDTRIEPSLTRDVIVKRIKRGERPEIALTKGVCDEAKAGDTKKRREAREQKMEQRARMFLLAQEVRKKYELGLESAEIMNRYDISKSQFEKFISGNEYYNIWWRGDNVPDKFKDIVDKIKKEKRDAKNM
jgi:hypothetical protein